MTVKSSLDSRSGDAVEVAGEVALEQTDGVACALAFADAAGDVVAGCRVVLAAVEDHRVQGAVELAVATAAEAVPDRLTARGGQRGDAGETGKAGFRADAVVVGPGDDQLCGDDWSDAGFVEQVGHERTYVLNDLALEHARFGWRGLDPSRERAQDGDTRELVRGPRV
jgi:hypothetical protein